ncbi:ROK family protein [Streptomyces sp. NBC_01465]|uniref:ROK family protein n=1 Tax=Streptomyces sp. NBC_01465 TaxID=2903878 RepID=UPI002E36B362|nr:ROK family protein [Streptomyces sp. NBC_01465]
MTPGFVLGIDFGGTKVALATMDTAGPVPRVLGRTRLPTAGPGGAQGVLRRSLAAAGELVAGTGGALTGVGVATIGVVDGERIRLAPTVPGWEDLDLPRLLRKEFGGLPLRIDNDVKAATAAELRWGRLSGVSSGLYLNIGTGLGAGIVAGGRVVPGAHGAAGEIAYLLRTPDEPGFAAGRAPLEEHVSGAALASRGAQLLGAPVSAAALFARWREPQVRSLLDESVSALAAAVANLCIALDPERVVVGGGLMGAGRPLLKRFRTALDAAVPFPPELTPARFVDEAALYGAVSLAMDVRS